MQKKLGAAIGGLVLVAALGVPAAAQAAAVPSGPAHAKVTAAATVTCDSIWDYGNGKYADTDGYLYFEPLSTLGTAGAFCNLTDRDVNGAFEIEDPSQPGDCLWAVTDPTLTVTVADMPCTTSDSYDLWYAFNTGQKYHSQSMFQLENIGVTGYYDNAYCLYDDLQEPAIFAGCSDETDHFEWFVWDALP
jgi:hypothetical protein